jgi:S1-C subfamily serine protease
MQSSFRSLVHAFTLLFPALSMAQSMPQTVQAFDSADIAKKVSPAVLLINGATNSGDILGSGVIISSDGKIATNLHVIQQLRNGGVQLASGDKFDSFSILAYDARKDIAIIKIHGFDLPSVPLGNSNNVQVGEPVLVVGSPLGLQGSVRTGVVSSLRDDPENGGFKVI